MKIFKNKYFWIGLVLFFIIYGQINKPSATKQNTVESTQQTSTNSTTNTKKQVAASSEKPTTQQQPTTVTSTTEQPTTQAKVPKEFKNALAKAKQYAQLMSMSKQGIYDQLTSEHGEKFPAEAAQYAIDNLQWDYKENALKKAKQYQDMMNMSTDAIRDQLVSEHGEKFTAEEAEYAIEHLE